MDEYEREVEKLGRDRLGGFGRSMLGVSLLVAIGVSLQVIMIDAGIESGAIQKIADVEHRIAEVLDVDYISKESGQVLRVIKYRWLEEADSNFHWEVSQYRPDGEIDPRNGWEPGFKIIFKDGELVLFESEE